MLSFRRRLRPTAIRQGAIWETFRKGEERWPRKRSFVGPRKDRMIAAFRGADKRKKKFVA